MPLSKGWLTTITTKIGSQLLTGAMTEIPKALGLPGVVPKMPEADLYTKATGDVLQFFSVIGGIVPMVSMLMPLLSTYYSEGTGRLAAYDTAKEYKTARLPIDTVVRLFMRDWKDTKAREKLMLDLADQGFNEDRINAFYDSMRPLIGTGEIKDLYLRGELGKDVEGKTAAIRKMQDLGFSQDDASQLFKLFFYIPPVPDLIRMVVREAWRDDIAELYKTDEGYEKLPFDTFAKAGVTPDWLRRYWRSHWELPSIQLAFEMLHRGEITEADIDQLLFTQDIMPFWRKPIKEIAYRVITRVDLRRLFREGIIDGDRLLKGYKNLGYNPDDAVLMSDWTKIAYPQIDETEQDKTRELTRTQVEKAYKLGLINRDEVLDLLISLGYDVDNAEFVVSLIDSKVETDRIEEEIKTLAQQYTFNLISREEFIAELGKLNLPGELSEFLLAKYDRAKATRTKRPSKEDFMRWFNLEIITENTLRAELQVTGYGDAYVDNYIKETSV